VGRKANRIGARLGASRPDELYLQMTSEWNRPEVVVYGARSSEELLGRELPHLAIPNFTLRMMHLDTIGYLPNDILVKLDRATMGVSLEGRVPLLDHRVVEFAWRLPIEFKRNGKAKTILRKVLYRHVPPHLIERPKQGFGIPIGRWLRGPLRDWSEHLLNERRLHSAGYLHPRPIRKAWSQHLAGAKDCTNRVWNVLMFQAWLEQVHGSSRPASVPELPMHTV